MMILVLLVCWIMSMFLWLLAQLGAVSGLATHTGWLAFFAVLILGVLFAASHSWPWPPKA